jgi:alpha-glucuronidase
MRFEDQISAFLRRTSAFCRAPISRLGLLRLASAIVLSLSFLTMPCLAAQTEEDAWLRYAALGASQAKLYDQLPSRVVIVGDSPVLNSAQQELVHGFSKMLGRTLRVEAEESFSDFSRNAPKTHSNSSAESSIILATLSEIHLLAPQLQPSENLTGDGYWLKNSDIDGRQCLVITAGTDRGVLYGVFALLSKIAREENISALDEVQQPSAPLRWINQWDNLDGKIERGYGGPSIFFSNGRVRDDLTRAGEYARLLASVGINGCAINNVNADSHVLDDAFILQVSRIADAFRPWGVQLALSVDLSSPKALGDLDTFDPLDPRVAEWWRRKVNTLYGKIPNFGGFVVKADSEDRAGPSTYGRTQADAANVIARALKPHGGVVFYRAFVYNHHLDWRDLKNDRAKAAYDIFHPLDGTFDDNVIVQIKNGPIDFQVREPVSPLFAGLPHTNEAIELQITQEYTGQQRQLCFLVPMWKEALNFDMRVNDKPSTVAGLVAGRVFHRPTGGVVGVANVGMDATWLGNSVAMANLYGFGRLAWDSGLSAQSIIDEWTRLTFGSDPVVLRTISALQLESWHVYESYTGPLGAGTLTNITGNHYDPAPESSEKNGWGQWHRADHDGIGMDRTVATGTGFIGQYPPATQKLYESLGACPDNLLLFFHHVPYTYKLHSGKTVIQHIYDSHYDGAEQTQDFVSEWKILHGHIDEERYGEVLTILSYQAKEAVVWRDVICNWIYQLSGIPDQRGRMKTGSEQ